VSIHDREVLSVCVCLCVCDRVCTHYVIIDLVNLRLSVTLSTFDLLGEWTPVIIRRVLMSV